MKVENVKDIINFAEINKYEAKASDVSYVVLENTFNNRLLAYRVLFSNSSDVTEDKIREYDKSEMIECIRSYMFLKKYILTNDEIERINNKNRISADENREGMIKLIATIEAAMKEKQISQKDGIARLVDIRSKLQNNFDIEATDELTHIIIPPSYNAICPYCGHEVTAKTQEYE